MRILSVVETKPTLQCFIIHMNISFRSDPVRESDYVTIDKLFY